MLGRLISTAVVLLLAAFASAACGSSTVRLTALPTPASALAVTTQSDSPSPFTHVAYQYSNINVLGIDLWTWNGTYCLVAREPDWRVQRSRPLAADELAALIHPVPVPAVPFLYRVPLGLLILGFVLTVGTPVAWVRRRALDRQAPETSPIPRLAPVRRAVRCPRCEVTALYFLCHSCGLLSPRAIDEISKALAVVAEMPPVVTADLSLARTLFRERLRHALERGGVLPRDDVRVFLRMTLHATVRGSTPFSESQSGRAVS